MKIKETIIEAMFPRFCVGCGREGELWCNGCDAGWQPSFMMAACPFCHRPGSDRVCSSCRSQVYLDGLSSSAMYGNSVVRKALSVWKYDRDRAIEPVIKKWLHQSAVRVEPPVAPYVVCGVPLHVGRRRMRGFDQAAQIATWVGEIYGLPVDEVLERIKVTDPQARQGGDSRQVGHLDTLFDLKTPGYVPEHVLLCDDVFTSGATMDAAARVLKEAGVKSVWGFVVARG